jgi:hypothetical protein
MLRAINNVWIDLVGVFGFRTATLTTVNYKAEFARFADSFCLNTLSQGRRFHAAASCFCDVFGNTIRFVSSFVNSFPMYMIMFSLGPS